MSGTIKSNQLATVALSKEQNDAIVTFVKSAQESLYNNVQVRSSMEEIDKQYQREKDWTNTQLRARLANRAGDATKMQNITVPIVMPQVESALTYLTNVFLTGYPIFGVGSNPSQQDAAIMMETIIAENSITAGWAVEMMKFFRDGLKYNIHCLEVSWEEQTVWSISPDTDLANPNGAKSTTVLWNGNVLRRIDLYNAFWDYRVHPHEIAEHGEFAGYTRLYSRMRMKKFINDLYDIVEPAVAIKALESPSLQLGLNGTGNLPFGYYQPSVNPFPFISPTNTYGGTNWEAWVTDSRSSQIDYKDAYTVTTCYGRIIPDDFGFRVPGKNTPQVWKFYIVNGSVVLMAARLSNVHNKIPMFFGQPISDGLDYQTKSFAQNVTPMQEAASSLWNGFIASKRRLVTDRVLYDPSRIRESDINSVNPSAKIPVRPTAYGQPLQEAVYQFPFRDEQAGTFILGAKEAVNFANMINNQNPAQQGQFVKGNKTRTEYEDVMGHGNGANQMMAINIENQVFVPLKEALKLNILQYQRNGQIFNQAAQQTVNIDVVSLRQAAVQFKVSDGILPEDKQLSTDELQVALQVLGSTPQLAQGYNLPPLFSYIMKLRGADLKPFEKSPLQLQYEQQLAAWQQAAAEAAKTGAQFNSPQPQPSPELQQELQQMQKAGGTMASASAATSSALASTQGPLPGAGPNPMPPSSTPSTPPTTGSTNQ